MYLYLNKQSNKFKTFLFLFSVLLFFPYTNLIAESDDAPFLFISEVPQSEVQSDEEVRFNNEETLQLNQEVFNQFSNKHFIALTVHYKDKNVVFNKKTSSTSKGITSWFGHDQESGSELSLTIGSNHLFGKITGTKGTLLFQPSDKPFVVIQREQDPNNEVELKEDGVEVLSIEKMSESGQISDDTPVSDDGTQIDVMVLFTNGMVQAYPGDSLNTRIQYLIDQTNLSFINSNINTRVRLVYSQLVNYLDDSPGDMAEALHALKNNEGVFNNVESLRNTYGIDQVTLLRKFVDEGCGRAYVIKNGGARFAYAVVQDGSKPNGSYCTDLTYAHEFGHNLGSAHNRENAGASGFFNYSYGFRDPAVPFRTVMSYNCVGVYCPRVNYFSNPNVSYHGVATGVSDIQPDSADNAKSMNLRRIAMATYRTAKTNEIVKRSEVSKLLLLAKNGYSYLPETPIGTVYSDVHIGDYNLAWIEQLTNDGITDGCELTRYCPNMVVTKDQLAPLLLKAKHGAGYLPPVATGIFSDVLMNQTNAPWIEALYNQGISEGCDNISPKYCPSEAVTMLSFLAMLNRTFP